MRGGMPARMWAWPLTLTVLALLDRHALVAELHDVALAEGAAERVGDQTALTVSCSGTDRFSLLPRKSVTVSGGVPG